MDRKTVILDTTAGLEIGQSQISKGKGKGKAKAAQKPNGVSKTPASQGAAAAKLKPARKAKPAAGPAAPQFWEEDGVKINLLEKGGRKRKHARLATALRKKTEDELLVIVKTYAGEAKSQEFKNANLRKLEIAEWIEAKETLALGPHPDNTPLVKVAESGGLNQANNGLNSEAPQTNGGKKRPSPEEDPSNQPPPKQQKQHPAPEPKQAARSKKDASPPRKLATAAFKADRLPTPAPREKMGEKPKEQGSPKPIKKAKPLVAIAQKVREVPEALPSPVPTAAPSTEEFMSSIGLDASHPDTATRIVRLPTQHESRVLTAYQHHSIPSFHSVAIPQDYTGDTNRRLRRQPPGFLKPGRHGPGGDFENDPDRATGRGHDHDPEDAVQYQEFLAFKDKLYSRFPWYPQVREGEVVEKGVTDAWREWQVWYQRFAVRYPGRRLDQWVCGCSKMDGEGMGGWQDGDSEEE